MEVDASTCVGSLRGAHPAVKHCLGCGGLSQLRRAPRRRDDCIHDRAAHATALQSVHARDGCAARAGHRVAEGRWVLPAVAQRGGKGAGAVSIKQTTSCHQAQLSMRPADPPSPSAARLA